MAERQDTEEGKLKRALTLPWLVFYGVGVTIGAGIFALIGQVLARAGDHAPLAFLLAGLIAGVTGVSYALLIRRYPLAGGEAVFVNRGLGSFFARIAGYGVATTGIISSAVIALAFAGYLRALFPVHELLLVVAVVMLLSAVAWAGVRESVVIAAAITFLELGALIVVIGFGLPLLGDVSAVVMTFVPAMDVVVLTGIVSSGILAFFAFIGFEDIVNMCEETIAAEQTVPRAVYWTLGITLLVYVLLAVIAALAENREAIVNSGAPMAQLFEVVSGLSGKPLAAIAAVAMVNGILVQIVMASRVLYGMANEGIAPRWFAYIDPIRQTPAKATVFVGSAILVLALFFPLIRLAEATSLVTLSVFALVNVALFSLGGRDGEKALSRMRWWGLLGALLCFGLVAFQLLAGLTSAH